jgi:hypothetical protein
MKSLILALLLLVPSSLSAQDKPKIILPDAPTPPPAPVPVGTPTQLAMDAVYVVRSTAPTVILSSPQATLGVEAHPGPLTIRAKFSDLPTVSSTRTFTEAWVYIVTPATSGQAELIIVPSGATDASTVIRRQIVAGNPAPPVPPTPNDPLTAALQAAYSSDTDASKQVLLTSLTGIMAAVVQAAQASGAVKTTSDLDTLVHNSTVAALGATALAHTRAAVGAYVGSKMGTTSVPLTPALWSTAGQTYGDVAVALGKVK